MMEQLTSFPIWLVFADLLGMVSVILALYVLVLNPRYLSNRLVSIAIAILAANTLTGTSLLRADNYQDIFLPMVFMVAITPAVGPALTMASLSILKPGWLTGKRSWVLYALILLAFMPGILTIFDLALGTSVYLIRPTPETYTGGYVEFSEAVSSVIGQLVIYLDLVILNAGLIIILAYLVFFDRELEKQSRDLALVLLLVQVFVLIASYAFENVSRGIINLVVGSLYIIAYGVAAFRQLISSRSAQVGRLQTRLTMLMVIIAVPALVFIATSLTGYIADQIEEDANSAMKGSTEFLATLVNTWLDDNAMVLRNLASQPDILSMDPDRQKVVLEAYARTYDYMYLISTTDLTGLNIARSDMADPIDYKDRLWFREAVNGNQLALQTLIGRTTGQPALVAAVPIYSDQGEISGTAMFASHLTDLNEQVLKVKLGKTGYAYLVDGQNQLLAHPDMEAEISELVNYSKAAPVQALRKDLEPPLVYADEEGITWRAYYLQLDNDWAVVLQQQESELLTATRELQLLSSVFIIGGGLVIVALVWASMRQAVQPIYSLTQAVKEIASGNLDRVVVVEGEDEVGTLARAFNIMTNQVRTLVSGLERRVAERTLDLEHRSAQLQAAAEVGRAAATMRNLNELLPVVTRLISERFGFYHVGIFLIDEQHEYAHLRAANSPGGQRMLARGHKLQVGQQGIVGYVTSRREPRVALNVGEDTAFFNNPDLPDTQSEMALPLLVGGELLGALDVQSVQQNAFTEQDVETLQVLADQVAIAINSALLLQRTEALLESERRGFGMITKHSWAEQIKSMDNIGFLRESSELRPLSSITDLGQRSSLQSGVVVVEEKDPSILYMPVSVRGQVIGTLRLAHDKNFGGWTEDEIGVIQSLAEQLGLALESARAYQQTQVSARRDRILGELSARVRESLDVQTILRTATREVRQVLDLTKVEIHLGIPPENGDNKESQGTGGSHA